MKICRKTYNAFLKFNYCVYLTILCIPIFHVTHYVSTAHAQKYQGNDTTTPLPQKNQKNQTKLTWLKLKSICILGEKGVRPNSSSVECCLLLIFIIFNYLEIMSFLSLKRELVVLITSQTAKMFPWENCDIYQFCSFAKMLLYPSLLMLY